MVLDSSELFRTLPSFQHLQSNVRKWFVGHVFLGHTPQLTTTNVKIKKECNVCPYIF